MSPSFRSERTGNMVPVAAGRHPQHARDGLHPLFRNRLRARGGKKPGAERERCEGLSDRRPAGRPEPGEGQRTRQPHLPDQIAMPRMTAWDHIITEEEKAKAGKNSGLCLLFRG